jgi:uncharacterized protein
MQRYTTPGVYKRDIFPSPASKPLRTGVPLFLGYAATGETDTSEALNAWPQFEEKYGGALSGSFLYYAVRGFFENKGQLCRVIRLDDALSFKAALQKGLAIAALLDDIDLICAPDSVVPSIGSEAPSLQQMILDYCAKNGECFAILDSVCGASHDEVRAHRDELTGASGALYYPWIRIVGGPSESNGFVPSSGHVAGVYARTDDTIGVHKAPANEVLEGVLDVERAVTNSEQGVLNPDGINCIRSFTGRGIRIWGARTLAGENDGEWTYVNVRRLFLTAIRWIERNMRQVVYEPNDLGLWARIGRELTSYFKQLYEKGALKGKNQTEAFYVKCDAETNTDEVQSRGELITEIGLAPAVPGEFIVVKIVHGTAGVAIQTKSTETPSSPVPTAGGSSSVARVISEVKIAHIEYDPKGTDLTQEQVTIENRGIAPQSMTGWILYDLHNHKYVFPEYELAPGEQVRIWTRSGENTETDLYWGRRIAVWSNIGDRARLRNSRGDLVDSYTYTPIEPLLSRK